MATDPRVEKLSKRLTYAATKEARHEAAGDLIAEVEAAGLAVFDATSEIVAGSLSNLIFERTQLVDADADDLAWDILALLRGEA